MELAHQQWIYQKAILQEKKRFVVPVSLLSQPSFQDLLHQAEEEYGYDHPMGGLTILCSQHIFYDLATSLGAL
ncbi:hypothetical protein Lser_V15G40276 [Lactuca serriola]